MKGRATTYTQTGSGGACNFGNAKNVNFGVPLNMGIAIQEANWIGATACGECYELSGPSSSKPIQTIVQDLCPKQGNEQWCGGADNIVHMDLLPDAFSPLAATSLGVIYTAYKKIPCPVSSTTNIGLYMVVGSNPSWVGITPINHRYGITKMEFAENGGSFQTIARNSNNFIAYQGASGNIKLPAQVRLTATTGEVVTIPLATISASTTFTSSVQFALNPTTTTSCDYVPDSTIYSDALNSGLAGKTVAQDWRTNSWGTVGSVNFDSTTNPRSGSKTIQAQFNNYGGLQIFTSVSIPFTKTTGLSFWIRGDSASTNAVDFNIEGDNSVASPKLTISLTTSWQQYSFAFATNATNMNNIKLLKWQSRLGGNTPNIYIDDVSLVVPAVGPSTIPPNSASRTGLSLLLVVVLILLY
jgi:expansin (peptidoglycan-binding protein)